MPSGLNATLEPSYANHVPLASSSTHPDADTSLLNGHTHGDNDNEYEKESLLPLESNGITREADNSSHRRRRRRPLLSRLAGLLPFGHTSRWAGGSGVPTAGGTNGSKSTWRARTRMLFDYPEPGLKLRKTAWLDALRGIAALEVFIFHYSDQWIEKVEGWGAAPDNKPEAWWTAPFIRSWYAAGNAAVCLFFAISGYVLTVRILGLIRRRQLEDVVNALSSAVMRRGIRLYLPIYITTFVLLNMEWLGFPKPMAYTSQPTYLGEVWHWWKFVTQGWMPLRFPDRFDELLNPYDGTISWTIPIEYYGSIITYVALLFTCKITTFRIRAPIFLLLIVMYTIKDEWYVVQFLFGMIYAEYQLVDSERTPSIVSRTRMHKAFAVFLLVFGFYLAGIPQMRFGSGDEPGRLVITRPGFDWLFPVVFYFQWYDSRQVDRYYQSFAANCILVGVGELGLAQRILEKRPFQYLGRISFGLYLSHIWVREGLRPLDNTYLSLLGLDTRVDLTRQPMGLAYCTAYTLRMLVSAPINFIVAGAFERTIDRGSVKLAKYFEQTLLSLNKKWSTDGGGGGGAIELSVQAAGSRREETRHNE